MAKGGKNGGGSGSGSIRGSRRDDTLQGTAGDDSIDARDGNDVIITAGGRDTVDGGAGLDTLQLDGPRGAWQAVRIDAQTVELTSITGDVVRCLSVEAFQFDDMTLDLASLFDPVSNLTASVSVVDSIEAGQVLEVDVTTSLSGSQFGATSTTQVVLATAPDIASVIDSVDFSGITLTDGQSSAATAAFTLDAGLAPGTYYVAVLADASGAVAETDETDNLSAWQTITVTRPPADFAVMGLSLSQPEGTPYELLTGDPLVATLTVANQSADPNATEVSVTLYLSQSGTMDGTEQVLSQSSLTLAAGQSLDLTETLNLPQDLATGGWQIGVAVAPVGLPDADLTDNAATVALNVQGGLFTGTAGDDLLTGSAGNDVVSGLSGNDTFIGSAGQDSFDGGAGTDVLDLSALGGTSDIAAYEDDLGRLNVWHDEGRLDVSGVEVVIGSDLGELWDFYLSQTSFTVFGGGGDDFIFGGDAGMLIDGGTGNDSLIGTDINVTDAVADDTLLGGAGDDVIYGGAGDDLLSGGIGADTFEFYGLFEGNDTITDFDVAQDILRIGVSNGGNPLPGIADLGIETSEGVLVTASETSGFLVMGVTLAELELANIDIYESDNFF